MRAASNWTYFLFPIFLGACGTGAGNAAVDPSTPSTIGDPASEAARLRLQLSRDPRCTQALPTEKELLERMANGELAFSQLAKTDPKRVSMASDLSRDHALYSCFARKERIRLLETPGNHDAAIASWEKLDIKAAKQAARYNALLFDDGRRQCPKEILSFPGTTCDDAVTYYLAFDADRSGASDIAQKLYMGLAREMEQSPFTALGYIGFGESLIPPGVGENEVSVIDELPYSRALDKGPETNPAIALALYRLALVHRYHSKVDEAKTEAGELDYLAQSDPKGSAAAALRLLPSVIVPKPPGSWMGNLDKKCSDGDSQACMDLGLALGTLGGDKEKPRMLSLFEKACEGGTLVGCVGSGTRYQNGTGTAVNLERAMALYDRGCKGNEPVACDFLGKMLVIQRKNPADDSRIFDTLVKSCAGITFGGCRESAEMLIMGVGTSKDEARAAGILEKLCQTKDPSSCIDLGLLYEQGRGVPKDESRAKTLYQKACDAKMGSGCNALGALFERPTKMGIDELSASTAYAAGCDRYHPRACLRLGVLYSEGRGVPKNEAKAASLYKKACLGHGEGCRRYGDMLAEGRILTKDEAKAAEFYTRACEQGDGIGCQQIGKLLKKGGNRDKDAAAAMPDLNKRCDGGESKACWDLGLLVGTGMGIPADETRASSLFAKACDAGQIEACAVAGEWLELGRGWPAAAYLRPLAFHKRACEGGMMRSCSPLGFAYETGHGLPMDDAKAAELYKKACDAGVSDGCGFLASVYLKGRGVPKNGDMVIKLRDKACAMGDERWCPKEH